MTDEPLLPGRDYIIKHCTRLASCKVTTLRYRIDVNTLHRDPTPSLKLNEIGRVQIKTNQPLALDGYRRNRGTGSFILIDRVTNVTIGAGMILDRKSAGDDDHWDDEATEGLTERTSPVTADERAGRYGQKPVTVLLTGPPASGKTPIAGAVERMLFDQGRAVLVLDGQSMRRGLSRDLGFSMEDRSENLRRAAEVAKMAGKAGLITIAAFVAPQEGVRRKAAEVIGDENLIIAHCSAPEAWRRENDEQGVYAKADSGEIASLASYEPPASPDLELPLNELSVAECAERVVKLLEERGLI
ncbi:MAG: adenylyl-sulfate kinase, partial [Planctomycetota bacterium]